MEDMMVLLRRLFDYDHWGNREVVASLSTVDEAVEKPRRVFSHVIGAQRIWLARFDSANPPSAEPWPTLSLDECRTAVEEIHERWSALLDKLTAETLSEDLMYRTTKGAEFKTPIRDVLLHLILHSAYHRGQVAAAVREAGGKPAATDYVIYVRQMKA